MKPIPSRNPEVLAVIVGMRSTEKCHGEPAVFHRLSCGRIRTIHLGRPWEAEPGTGDDTSVYHTGFHREAGPV